MQHGRSVKEEVRALLSPWRKNQHQIRAAASFRSFPRWSALHLIMDLVWMILLLFPLSAEAKNLTEVKVDLGQTVTLNCSVNKTDVHWYMETLSHIPEFILRTFTEDPDDNLYNDSTLRDKFIGMGKRLVITNISAEDFRLYFCATRKNNNIIFEDAFRLISGDRIRPSTNDSEESLQQSILENKAVIYSSVALNALLPLVVMGLIYTCLLLKRKNSKDQASDPSPFTCDNTDTLETPQYEEIHLPSYRSPPPATTSSECIYHKAQFPQCTPPSH